MRIYTLFLLIFIAISTLAQAPSLINYQAVVRGQNGNILPDKLVSLKISILQGSALGQDIYVETHQTATNSHGLINIKIGNGTMLNGIFEDIEWHTGTYFLKLDIDINAGTNYEFLGTTQLLSVPYALYAQEAETVRKHQTITKSDSTVTLSHNGGSFIDSDNQNLILQGTELYISGGNSVTIGGVVDLDWDPTNELQDLHLSNDTLYISMGNHVYLPYDRDSTNELQSISKSNDTIYLSLGGGYVIDNDNQNLSLNTSGTLRNIDITDGTGITIDVADFDNDPTNELQFLYLINDTLFISQGNYVYLSYDKDSINELQTLSIDNKILSISKGNSVEINYGPKFIGSINLGSVHTTQQSFDLSQYVPFNTTSVILEVTSSQGGTINFNAGTYNNQISMGSGHTHQIIIPINNNRIFYSSGSAGTFSIILKAYF